MVRRVLIAAVVALSLTPNAAGGQVDPLTIARAAWPGSPCAGIEQIHYVPQLTRGDGTSATGAAVRETCTVDLVDTSRSLPQVTVCSLLAHELGHLAGYGHPDEDVFDGGLPDPPFDHGAVMLSTGGTWHPCVAAFVRPPAPLTLREAIVAVRRRAGPARRRGITCRREAADDMRCIARRRGWATKYYVVLLGSGVPRQTTVIEVAPL